jgi:cytochrome c2
MKISKMLNIKSVKPLVITALFLLFLGNNSNAQPDGEKLFKANCASCHKPDKDFIGPALMGAKTRWEENSSLDNLYAWVKNSQAVIESGDAYATELFGKWNNSVMAPQAVNVEEIDAIMDYVDNYTPPVKVDEPPVGSGSPVASQETSTWIWWVIGGLLLVVIFAVGGVKKELNNASLEQDGEEPLKSEGFLQSARRYLWENFNYAFFFIFIAVIGLLVVGFQGLTNIGVMENYKPDQPIAFSHKLHAGDLEVECVYCHNSAEKSKHAGIPTVNVCMNCHKGIVEGTTTGTEEISKIHNAAGFDPSTMSYSGETEPIKWVKVHNMPDHVYFNHSQHVVVGGLDCAQCHGDMKNETVARVMTTEDLNAVEDNDIKFTRPTLTMGWCIECHGQKSVDIKSANASGYYKEIHNRLNKDKKTYQKYLEDDKITVAELGGWECAKCHY